LSNLEHLRQQARIYFNFEKNLTELLATIDKLPVMNISEFRENHSLDERIYDIFLEDHFGLTRSIIHYYENSKSWKLTRPLRYFSRLIKRQENGTPADLLENSTNKQLQSGNKFGKNWRIKGKNIKIVIQSVMI